MCCNFTKLDMFVVGTSVLKCSRRLTKVNLRLINIIDVILDVIVSLGRKLRLA